VAELTDPPIPPSPPASFAPASLECPVREIVEDPRLRVTLRRVAGEAGLDRPIRHPRVQKCGLALAGHFYGVVPTRVQVLGETELSYLDSLSGEGRSLAARGFFSLGLSCVVVTRNAEPARALVTAAEATGTPLFVSDGRSSRTINALHALLDDRLAPQTQLHGVLVDVFGVGLLVLGKSGIGKSECALELVLRGHRLVADDVVQCEWRPPGIVFGAPADLLRNHIEVRGLGVLNIKDLFGVTSVRERKRIDVVVQLEDWSEKREYDRLGVEDNWHVILGTPIRLLTVPVRPGRDMGSILEIAARNELLRRAGANSAKDFLARLEGRLVPGEIALDDPPNAEGAAKGAPAGGAATSAPVHASARPPGASPSLPGSKAPLPPKPPASWTTFEHSPNESSAWIPAVRPKGDDE
jgi:HPr kinase/phosphorylase